MKIPHRKKDLFLPAMFASAILLSAICFFSHASGTSTLLSKSLSLVTTPLRAFTRSADKLIGSVGEYFSDINELKKENQKLIAENKALKRENSSLSALKNENDALYGFLDLKKEHTDYRFTNANIISKASSNYLSTFTIDKGSFHDVTENLPVISDSGALIGVTYSAEPNSTRCKSILSYDTKVGVYDKETGETGILSGSFDTFRQNRCVMEGLSDDTSVKEGDTILTSGLGEIYPRDLIIGKVCGFIPELGSHTQSAVIELDESILASDSIMVITSFRRIYA